MSKSQTDNVGHGAPLSTENAKEICKRILELDGKGTKGPWRLTFEEPEGFPCVFLDEAKERDVTIRDLNLIDEFRSLAPDLAKSYLELAGKLQKAVEAFHRIQEGNGNYLQITYEALKAIRGEP